MIPRITKRDAERLIAGVDAAGDDSAAVRDVLAEWVPRDRLDALDLDALFALAARLNEERRAPE
jgi:hypothetical protein